MTITITISHEFAGGALQELRELSAGLLYDGPRLAPPHSGEAVELQVADALARQRGENIDGSARRETIPVGEASKRTRRTKAQIEADEAAAKAAAQPTPLEAAISATPEDRTNPDDAVAETAEEEADGVEDMADAPATGVELTLEQKRDTLRGLAGRITLKLGNNLKLAQDACVPIFAANGVQSISTCPEDKIDVVHAGLLAIANG